MKIFKPMAAGLAMLGWAVLMPLPCALARPQSGQPEVKVACLLLLDADTFLCAPCLSRTLASLRNFNSGQSRAGLWAVVLYNRPAKDMDERLYQRMIARRAESVFKASGLDWPIVVDEAENWRELSGPAAELLVLDPGKGSVRAYPLPLSPESAKEIQNKRRTS